MSDYPRALYCNEDRGTFIAVNNPEEEAEMRAKGYYTWGQRPEPAPKSPTEVDEKADDVEGDAIEASDTEAAPRRRGRPRKAVSE